jgi:hypothetical protein
MSFQSGFFALRGHYLDCTSEVFTFFKLIDTGNDGHVTSWDEVVKIVNASFFSQNGDTQKRAVWFDNGWTIFEDIFLILPIDEEALTKLSRHFSTPVFSLVTQGTSSCYGFWYFDQQKIRSFFNTDGEVTDDFGEPLLQEEGCNISSRAFYDDVHGVAVKFGIDWEKAYRHHSFVIKHLRNSEELNQEIEEALKKSLENAQTGSADEGANPSTSLLLGKPWWKFW